MSKENKYSFNCDWYDAQASLVRKYLLFYYYNEGSIEMFDIKNRRTFLKKTTFADIKMSDLYVGSTLTIYGRQLKVTEFADAFTTRALSQARQRTFAMVKPHAFENVGAILDVIESHGLKVDKVMTVHLTRPDAQHLYEQHHTRPFFDNLINMVTSGPIVAMELIGPGSITAWRNALGPTDPDVARKEAQDSIRARFGIDVTRNAAHGSDSEQAAGRELDFFFGRARSAPFNATARFENCTLGLIKPHAVLAGYAGRIMDAILEAGFKMTAIELFHLDRASAEEFYEVYKGVVPEFPGMVDQLTAGPCIAIEVRAEDAVPTFRTLCGPPDPEIARHIRPNTLRAMYGTDKVANAVHCTDLPEDGTLEVEYFFKILHGQ